MAARTRAQKRAKGSVEELPSGALRVSVYAGIDPVTKKRHYLRETIPADTPNADREADKAVRRLQNQVDERRQPRTSATVNQLLDRYFLEADLEFSTLDTYRGYAEKHIRPLLGTEKVGSLDAGVMDSLYAELRRCRDHCKRNKGLVDHRTTRKHECDDRCLPHECRPLSSSTIRQIHFVLYGGPSTCDPVEVGHDQSHRWCRAAGCAEVESTTTDSPASCTSHQRGIQGPRLGRTRLADHGDRAAARRTLRHPVGSHRPRQRRSAP
jgi:hypothetical protein